MYWANGAIPMHVLLGNTAKLAELNRTVDYVLAQQDKNGGWLGPLVNGSSWSSFRGATCLCQWAEGTGDARVVPALFRYATRLVDFLSHTPLAQGSWSQMRWQEGAAAMQWLIDHAPASTPAADLEAASALIGLLAKQGMDWAAWIESDEQHPWVEWSHKRYPATPYQAGRDMSGGDLRMETLPRGSTHADCEKLCNATPACVAYVWADCDNVPPTVTTDCYMKASVQGYSSNKCRNARVMGGAPKAPPGFTGWFPNNTADADSIGTNAWQPAMDRMWTHGVNLGQAMDVWAVMYRYTGDKAWLARGKAGWDKIIKYHGQATGVMTGDETLSGLAPDRGTETCTVVETLNSAAEMFLTSGETHYADRAERIAYNALPGAFMNGTMWSLNYFQQVNKLDAIDGCEDGCTYCFGIVYAVPSQTNRPQPPHPTPNPARGWVFVSGFVAAHCSLAVPFAEAPPAFSL